MAVVLSSRDIERYKADGQELEVFWRSETPVGLPLDYAHPEPSHRHALTPPGPRPASFSSAEARPSNSDRRPAKA
jgi:hypothetical protein